MNQIVFGMTEEQFTTKLKRQVERRKIQKELKEKHKQTDDDES